MVMMTVIVERETRKVFPIRNPGNPKIIWTQQQPDVDIKWVIPSLLVLLESGRTFIAVMHSSSVPPLDQRLVRLAVVMTRGRRRRFGNTVGKTLD